MSLVIQHDQLFKKLLREFFVEFLDLFVPAMSRYMDRGHIEFLDKEILTDPTEGRRHEADLVAKTRFRGQDACFLIHVEAQSTAQTAFPRRMFHYFAGLHLRLGLPEYPIVVFSYDRPRRAEPAVYEVSFPDARVLQF